MGKLLIFNLCFVCVGVDIMMVFLVLILLFFVVFVCIVGGKVLFENFYILFFFFGVKLLNSFVLVYLFMYNIIVIEDLSVVSGRYVE